MGQRVSKRVQSKITSESASVVANGKAMQSPIIPESMTVRSIDKNSSTRPLRARIVQNFTLLWLDSNINDYDRDFTNSLSQLRQVVNTIDTFHEPDKCIRFLIQVKDEKVFVIVSGALSRSIVPLIHDLSQLDSIYIFCANKSKYEKWATDWTKVKGIFTEIEPICDMLKQDTRQCDDDAILISVSSKGLENLEPSFMYTQLLKEILLAIEYDNKAKIELIEFCREQFHNNLHELQIIDEFERLYEGHTPIWWYTRECFTYQLLNRALRIQDVEVIIKMGFFLRDVHRHIEELHSKMKQDGVFTVYRGKTMTNVDFVEIKTKEGGLSLTTICSKVAKKPGSVGVLFQITIDPSIPSTPYASVATVSAIPNEEEILFSMHTVFRIAQIEQIEERIWRVKLALTSDEDQELKELTNYIRQTTSASTALERLGQLLIKSGNFNKAEEIYKILLEETSKDDENMHAFLYCFLGDIKNNKGDHKEALICYHKSLEIRQKIHPPIHPDLANTYNYIGSVHDSMAEYSTALEFYQQSLEIGKKYLPSDQPNMAEICNNIGAVYCHIGEYPTAIKFYQKSLEISLKTLPPNHPDLGATYNNIGQIHHFMQEYVKSLEFYQQSLEIRQKSLPPNHPDLGILYSNIGLLYGNIGDFTKALEFYQKDLEIKRPSLPSNHPSCAITYNNIGLVYSNMKEHAKALEFYQKSLEINLISLPPNHPELATNYNNIGLVHNKMQEYGKALEFIEKSLQIKQIALPSNHPDLALTYSNIGLVHWNMKDYSKALLCYERAVDIAQHSLPQDHPYLLLYRKYHDELQTICTSV